MAVVDQDEGYVGDETRSRAGVRCPKTTRSSALAMESDAHGGVFARRRGVVLEAAPSESAMEHAWAQEEDASLPEEDIMELLAM